MKLNVIFTINLVLVCLWFTWREMRIRTRKGLVQVIQLLSTPLGVKTQSLYRTHFPPFHSLSSITWSMNLSGTQFPFIDMPQFSCSVVSNSLRPHESHHTRPPCPSPTPRVYPNSCPLSWWCYPTISSSAIPFSSCSQSLPASGSFPVSQLFASGGQRIGVSASASVPPMNTQDWSPLGWTGWISLQSKGLSRVFSNTTVQKHHFFGTQLYWALTVCKALCWEWGHVSTRQYCEVPAHKGAWINRVHIPKYKVFLSLWRKDIFGGARI